MDDSAGNRDLVPQLSVPIASFSADDPGSWDHVIEQAQVLDDAGVDRVVVSDHVVFGEHLDEYGRPEIGGREGGAQPTGSDGHWLEPLTFLTYVAASTSRVRLGTNILVAALRRPVVLAKVASTLDVLSKGRLDLGVGVGWQREEYDAAGLDFDRRGRALDVTLQVCQTLWRDQRATVETPSLTFRDIHMMPKPVQPGGVPIWVSGTVNPRVVQRVARFGSGWIPWGADQDDVITGVAKMRDGLVAAGRDPRGLQVVGTLAIERGPDGVIDADATMAPAAALVAAGVTDVRVPLRLPSDRSASLELAHLIVSAFRRAVGPRTSP
jgi:probable F420-dependent oxidoreductase